MDAELQAKIDKAVSEHLPTALGTALRERLEQAEIDARDVKSHLARIDQLKDQLAKTQKKLTNLTTRIENLDRDVVHVATIATLEPMSGGDGDGWDVVLAFAPRKPAK